MGMQLVGTILQVSRLAILVTIDRIRLSGPVSATAYQTLNRLSTDLE